MSTKNTLGWRRNITVREKPNSYPQQPHWWEVGYLVGGTMFSADDNQLELMHHWCEDVTDSGSTIFGLWSRTYNTFSFHDRSTFMMFKMRWHGHDPE